MPSAPGDPRAEHTACFSSCRPCSGMWHAHYRLFCMPQAKKINAPAFSWRAATARLSARRLHGALRGPRGRVAAPPKPPGRSGPPRGRRPAPHRVSSSRADALRPGPGRAGRGVSGVGRKGPRALPRVQPSGPEPPATGELSLAGSCSSPRSRQPQVAAHLPLRTVHGDTAQCTGARCTTL